MARNPRLPPHLLALAAAVLLVVPSGGQDLPRSGGPAPRAVVTQPVWDAGAVARGATVRHDFALRNEGNAELRVHEVQATCGCTVAKFDQSIPPGAAGVVTAEVHTEAFRGPIAKDVTVLTNDPANPSIVLTLRADVRPLVDAAPGYVHFVHVQGAAAPTSKQTVWSGDQAELAVLAVESPLPAITVAFRPAADGERSPDGRGRQWVLTATLDSEAPPGPLSGDLVVRTNHPQQPTLLLPLAGYVRPRLMVSPPVADFGSFPPSEPRRGSVILTNYAEAPLRVLGVESDVKGVTAQVSERDEGKKFDLNLTVAAGVARGALAGTLRVRTDSPQHPVIEIPIKGEVR
jgi:hypothetical protein